MSLQELRKQVLNLSVTDRLALMQTIITSLDRGKYTGFYSCNLDF